MGDLPLWNPYSIIIFRLMLINIGFIFGYGLIITVQVGEVPT